MIGGVTNPQQTPLFGRFIRIRMTVVAVMVVDEVAVRGRVAVDVVGNDNDVVAVRQVLQ